MICTNCGTTLSDGTKECPNCGVEIQSAPIGTKASSAPATGSVPEDKKTLLGILAIVAPVGIHSFMLGEKKKGILHILLLFPGVFLFVVPYLAGVAWSVYEGIKIFKGSYVVDPDKWFAL